VAEEIEVRLAFDGKHSDEDIAAAAIQRLAWNTSVPRDAVKLKVEKGWVTLTGEVHWRFQKDAAATDVRFLMGVIGVSDNPFGLVVREDNPAKTFAQFLDQAKRNPGKVNIAVPGKGSPGHLMSEQIATAQGLKWTTVPYRGTANHCFVATSSRLIILERRCLLSFFIPIKSALQSWEALKGCWSSPGFRSRPNRASRSWRTRNATAPASKWIHSPPQPIHGPFC